MSTETKLWQSMRRANDKDLVHPVLLTRFENHIALGVADVEYVSTVAHGWLELKVGWLPRYPRRRLMLQQELKVTQQLWLMNHNRPSLHLYSWLLVGIAHHSNPGWSCFLLIEPKLAALVAGQRVTWGDLKDHPHCLQCANMDDVLHQLRTAW